MNNRLVDMAEDDHLFAKVAPNLFGDSFAKKAKEHDEELKCLNHASLQGRDHRKTSPGGRNQFFGQATPPSSPGGVVPTTPRQRTRKRRLPTPPPIQSTGSNKETNRNRRQQKT